ncbi:MAG TPA: hypothetical protein VNO53_04280 [Steroidobacteraceae bacterium]|nr:hypothetical protein [Steroidobacteraceae bacterium]
MTKTIVLSLLIAAAASTPAEAVNPPRLLESAKLPVAVEPEALQRQFDALSAMPDVEIEYSPLGPVTAISGRTGVVLPRSVREFREGSIIYGLLEALGPALLATGREDLVVTRNEHSSSSRDIRTEQTIRGLPVVDGRVAVSIDEKSGEVLYVGAAFLPDRGLPKKPRLTAAQAWQALVRALEASGDAMPGSLAKSEKPYLAYYGAQSYEARPRLVWAFRASFTCPTGRHDNELVWVDAIDGSIAGRRSTILYVTSPGPCQREEVEKADCESAPHYLLADAPYSSSCQEAQVSPKLIVTRLACSNSFRLIWPKNPGASQYHVIRAPKSLGWAFARTVATGYVHQCTAEVDATNLVRMRACDGCGCGPWSETLVMDPQAACQAEQ